MVSDIAAAAADPDVVMWFGPDEVDFNDDWAEAAGIRRLLRGSSPALDALLHGEYAPTTAAPYLPAAEPAHDPYGLPFVAALNRDQGLRSGTLVYDVLMPVTYPFTSTAAAANSGEWGTQRATTFGDAGAPVTPVLQLVGIAEMGLVQPTPAQLRAEIGSALVHSSKGAFYYNLFSDKASYPGRTGWFAPDAKNAWAALVQMHQLEDALMPVLYSDSVESEGKKGAIGWRSWSHGARSVVVLVNPTAKAASINLDAVAPGAAATRARVRRLHAARRHLSRHSSLRGSGARASLSLAVRSERPAVHLALRQRAEVAACVGSQVLELVGVGCNVEARPVVVALMCDELLGPAHRSPVLEGARPQLAAVGENPRHLG